MSEKRPDMDVVKKYPTRGFGSLDTERRKAIASLGGKAAHAEGRGRTWTPEEAKVAGSKGGRAAHANRLRRLRDSNPRDVAILGGDPSL